MTKKKVAVIYNKGLGSFLNWVDKIDKNKYMTFKYATSNTTDVDEAMDWADIIWFEFGNEPAIYGLDALAKAKTTGKQVIVRIHAYEIFNHLLNRLNWETMTDVVFVSDHCREIADIFCQNDGKPPMADRQVKVHVIPNGLHVDRTALLSPGFGYNIAVVGFINYKKAPPMVMQILQSLVKIDKRYKIHWAGAVQDTMYEVYLQNLVKKLGFEKNIAFYGHVDDMDAFWVNKNFLLSCSVFEGHGLGMAEAMLRGIPPVVHSYFGAEDMFPKEGIFDLYTDAVDMMRENSPLVKGDGGHLRQWVIDKGWEVNAAAKKIEGIFK